MELWKQYLFIAIITLITAPLTTWLTLFSKYKFYNRKIRILHMCTLSKFNRKNDELLQKVLQKMNDGKFEYQDKFENKKIIVI